MSRRHHLGEGQVACEEGHADMAEELLNLYAARKPSQATRSRRHALAGGIRGRVPVDLTSDQQTAIEDHQAHMESPMPMDRLLCGDVGYGKTEVSLRAAFKTVMTASRWPKSRATTVLAFQHVKTLGERFAGFPVRIDLTEPLPARRTEAVARDCGRRQGGHLRRHPPPAVERRGVPRPRAAHRRRGAGFGVAHKEKIKQLRKKVDVSRMTAPPIPRTLNMSLVGSATCRDRDRRRTPGDSTNVGEVRPGGDHAGREE